MHCIRPMTRSDFKNSMDFFAGLLSIRLMFGGTGPKVLDQRNQTNGLIWIWMGSRGIMFREMNGCCEVMGSQSDWVSRGHGSQGVARFGSRGVCEVFRRSKRCVSRGGVRSWLTRCREINGLWGVANCFARCCEDSVSRGTWFCENHSLGNLGFSRILVSREPFSCENLSSSIIMVL